MEKRAIFNELPRPTFRWLKVNYTESQIEEGQHPAMVTVFSEEGIVAPLGKRELLKESFLGANKESLEAVTAHYTAGFAVTVPDGAHEKVEVVIDADADTVNEKTRIFATVGENATLELLYHLKGRAESGNVTVLTEVLAKKQANVTVKKVQLLGEGVQQIEHRYTKFEDDSKVEYINVELGGKENILYYDEDLIGERAELVHDLAYLGEKEQRFDISMLMSHIGKKTVSDIHTLGALSGKSKKAFRGTLDFIRGSVASEGAEEDTCLLLDPEVKSISLPLLLCKEDNVVGNHAASAGQLDQTKLFYLMSRGFSESEAKHIIVESMLRPIIDRIGNEDIEEAALAAVRAKI